MIKKSLFAAFALAAAFSASAAVTATEIYTPATGLLRVGSGYGSKASQNANVKAAQMALNACNGSNLAIDGKFGPMTAAQFRAFQTAKSIKVDGVIGAQTSAKLAECSTGSTTPVTPVTPVTPSGVEGYISDINSDSSNQVTTVYESETNKVVAGMRFTAKLSDQKLESVRVTFKNANTTSSSNLGKYFTSVSLMNGSTVLKTMTIAEADRANDDTYTFQFTGLGANIAKDTIGRFYVAVNGTGSVDSTDATNARWTVKFLDARTSSPNGVYVVNSSSPFPITRTDLQAGKFGLSGVKVTLSTASSNPVAMTKEVSETSETKDIKLLDFTVKADLTDVKLRNLPVTIDAKTAAGVAIADQTAIINTVKLMKGTEMVDNASAIANGVYTFTNLASNLATVKAGTTDTFSIVVDVKRQKNGSTDAYASGSNLTAKVTSIVAGTWSVQDVNGDQIVSRSGSAQGNMISLFAKGVTLTKGTSTVSSTSGSANTAGTFRINFKVTAVGDTVYVADTAATNLATLKNASGAAVTGSTSIAPAAGSSVSKEGNFYRINAGETKDFTVTVTYSAATAGVQYRAALDTFTYKVGTTSAADSTYTADLVNYNTDFLAI